MCRYNFGGFLMTMNYPTIIISDMDNLSPTKNQIFARYCNLQHLAMGTPRKHVEIDLLDGLLGLFRLEIAFCYAAVPEAANFCHIYYELGLRF